MRVVAVVALNQTFIHPVVIGFGKVRLGRDMASVAQLGLVFNEQMFLFFGMMRRVAVETSDIIACVRGFRKMRLRMTLAVAGKTAGAGLLA